MPKPTSRPLEVFSSGNSGLVMPISLRYASAENDSRLACWFFQPKRPTRIALPAFEHRHHDGGAANLGRLRIADRQQRFVGDALDEAVAERVGRDAERADVVFERDALDDCRVGRARVDQRAAERFEEAAGRVHPSGAMLGDLAGAAGDDVLVALGTALRVVGRAEAVGDHFDFLEDEAVVVERAVRHDVIFIDRVERRSLPQKAVGAVVEAGRRLAEEIRLRDCRRFLCRHSSRMLEAAGGAARRPSSRGPVTAAAMRSPRPVQTFSVLASRFSRLIVGQKNPVSRAARVFSWLVFLPVCAVEAAI